MFQSQASIEHAHPPGLVVAGSQATSQLEQLFRNEHAQRRRLRAHETIFLAGQQRHALYFVHA